MHSHLLFLFVQFCTSVMRYLAAAVEKHSVYSIFIVDLQRAINLKSGIVAPRIGPGKSNVVGPTQPTQCGIPFSWT